MTFFKDRLVISSPRLLACEQAFGCYFFPQTESLFTGYQAVEIENLTK